MNLAKFGLALSVGVASLAAFSSEAFAGSIYKSSYSSSSSGCYNCSLDLPASHQKVKLVAPGTQGTIRKASTTSTRTVTIEDTYDFDIIVRPTGVSSKVINVDSTGVTLPCTECTLKH